MLRASDQRILSSRDFGQFNDPGVWHILTNHLLYTQVYGDAE